MKTRNSSRGGDGKTATAQTANSKTKKRAKVPTDDDTVAGDRYEEEPVPKKARRRPSKSPVPKTSTHRRGTKSREPAVSKPTLLSTFQSIAGGVRQKVNVVKLLSQSTRQRTDDAWDSLVAGTPWRDDHEVALAALAASLSPTKLVDLAEAAAEGKDNEDDDFTSKARQTIVALFDDRLGTLNVSRVKRHTVETGCRFLWEGLAGTPWCGRRCTEVAAAALRVYLDPTVLADADVLATPESATELLHHCVTKQNVKTLWRLLSKKVQRAAPVSFEALERGVITFRQLPAAVKTEAALLAGLRQNQLSWESLPPEMQQDVQYALAISPDAPSPLFAQVWETVVSDEKDRLWTELAVQQPDRLELSDWQTAPDSLKDNADLMRNVVVKEELFASFISDRLATDFAFIDSILAKNLQALMWLPRRTYECFPHIINNSTMAALDLTHNTYLRLVDQLSERHHWSDRNFVLRFVYHALVIPEAFQGSNDVELYKALVLGCRLKKARGANCEMFFSNCWFFRFGTQGCLALLRYGEYECVRRSFDPSSSKNESYKVWVARHRHEDRLAPGRKVFPVMALDQLQTFHGYFTFVCGMKSQPGHGDGLLRKLDQAGINAKIASYLDFPKGLELEDLLVAAPIVAPSFVMFHPYNAVVASGGKDHGAELIQTLNLDPAASDYGHQYAIDQQQQKQQSETSSDGSPH